MLKGNYLVAGAGGLMGSAALLKLSNLPGVNVRAVDIREPKISADNISYIKADLRNFDECKRVVKNIDYVLMFAAILSTAPVLAKNPVLPIRSNIIMNVQMLEAAYFAGVKKFLLLSSSTGYPLKEGILKEENMFDSDPPDVYFSVGWVSRYIETLCRMYATKLKKTLPIAILRPTCIYGEYEDFHFETCHFLPALIRKVVERQKPIEVWGTGENKRDLIYASDVFDACLLALEKVDDFNVFNIGAGKEYSINEFLRMILEIDNFQDAKIVHNTSKPSTINKRSIDFSKAKNLLGFEAKTPIRTGITNMIKYYKSHPIKKCFQ
jgi:GDP-L-fucose synthase